MVGNLGMILMGKSYISESILNELESITTSGAKIRRHIKTRRRPLRTT